MSRTDKDLPWWFTEWVKPAHGCDEYGFGRGECDLPDVPTLGRPQRIRAWLKMQDPQKFRKCRWDPVQPPDRRGFWAYQHGPSREFNNLVWHGPQRRKVREFGRKAIAEYHGSGDVEEDLPNYQHRHCGKWLWF